MTIMARLARVLLALCGTLLLTAGAALLWADAQLARSAPQQADVVLSGPRVTDLDLPVDNRGRHLQVLTVGEPAGIGSATTVQLVDEPFTVGRLATDGRWATVGFTAVATGLLLLAGALALRRRRRRRDRSGRSVPAAAAGVVSVLLLSGCSWAGDDVDRDAYRGDRAALAAAFPAAPVSGVPPEEFADVPATPVGDPETAAAAMVALAGLPADPYSTTTARFLARQLFDPALLCGTGSTEGVRELLGPRLLAQVGTALDEALARIPACAGSDLHDMRLTAAAGAVSSQLPGNQAPGHTVRLQVTATYAVPSAGTGGSLWSIEREVALGFLADQPDRAVTLELLAADAGPGIGSAALPDPAAAPPWDEELLAGIGTPDPHSAAEVVAALAATMAADARTVGHETSWEDADGTLQQESWSGTVLPAAGQAQLQLRESTAGPDATEVRVLDQRRQFLYVTGEEADPGWRLYATAEPPQLDEGSTTDNPFALLDWLRQLSAAAPTPCPDRSAAAECHLVEVPTGALLTPGTLGYREAVVHARRGNAFMRLLVGVTDGELSAITSERSLGALDGDDGGTRVRSTWTFGAWQGGEVPSVAEPSASAAALVR